MPLIMLVLGNTQLFTSTGFDLKICFWWLGCLNNINIILLGILLINVNNLNISESHDCTINIESLLIIIINTSYINYI